MIVNQRQRLAALGLPAGAATVFRTIAAARAPEIARLWTELHQGAWARARVAALPPRWRAPWPQDWREPIDWRRAQRLAVAAVDAIHPALGRRAGALVAMGRAQIAQDLAPHTRPSRFGPPRIVVRFDGASETPLVLAHELGHATQMWRWGTSRPAPLLAGSEVAAHVAERGFHTVYARDGAPRAAAARVADDILAMLVRHPARDALEQAAPADWEDIAARFAPGHAWSADPPPLTARAQAEPLSTLGYAMAATLAIVLHARLDKVRDAYLAWVCTGPEARFEDAAALLGLAADDPALYNAAYDIARDDLMRARRLA